VVTVRAEFSPQAGVNLPSVHATDPPSPLVSSGVLGCLSCMPCVPCVLASKSSAGLLLHRPSWSRYVVTGRAFLVATIRAVGTPCGWVDFALTLATSPPALRGWRAAESSWHVETVRSLAHIHQKGGNSPAYLCLLIGVSCAKACCD
jgi:hypothetical protein